MTHDLTAIARRRYATKAYAPGHQIPEATLQQLHQLLRLSPSSINSQPWHFVVADTPEGQARIAKATEQVAPGNTPKILQASQVIVLCVRMDLDDAYLGRLLAQEEADGRFATSKARSIQAQARQYYVDLHRELDDVRAWAEKQVYLALGGLLLGAASLGIDATPIEGFDAATLDVELDLPARGLSSLVLAALGQRAADDPNAGLPKSRWSEEQVFTFL